jgi:hypothetical protein
MTLVGHPYSYGRNSDKFETQVTKIYSSQFLNDIFVLLDITDKGKKDDFKDFVVKVSTSYLSAKDMNQGRIQPNEQKKIFKKYIASLNEVQKYFQEIQKHNSTSANFNDSLRDAVKNTKHVWLQEMFHHYVSLGDGKLSLGSISSGAFDEFIKTLIEAAQNAPEYMNEHDKANIDKEYILWWLHKIGTNWERFTKVSFGLGDWFKEDEWEEKDIDNPDKRGRYKSTSLDVLYDLLKIIDKKITRADIETAMRKYKKL